MTWTPGEASRSRTVAIMQPYFIPYAGYFRLFTGADLFVVCDDVQFPRRGWLHRNKLIDHKQFIARYGDDMPEITGWRWGQEAASAGIRSTEADNV